MQSLIVASNECSTEWLCQVLRPDLLSMGEHAVIFDPTTLDVRPVRYGADGKRQRSETN